MLPITEAIVKRFIAIKLQTETKGEKLADFDLLIAATALEHNLALVTKNTKHFQRIKGLLLA
ncbi:type II toxin-antitoxin system VapC family toxin [Candidatus Gottesmanbacteria bacterium]|nr:type II toxin-antitoxin system VapC family toxin [Candidatus Gottesmanbacteria bacterium]